MMQRRVDKVKLADLEAGQSDGLSEGDDSRLLWVLVYAASIVRGDTAYSAGHEADDALHELEKRYLDDE